MRKPKETKEPEEKKNTSSDVLQSFLKQNSEDHYNFEETIDYKVSSGSLQLDTQLGGGFGPGLHRFVGMNEGGKTSALAEFDTYVKRLEPFFSLAEGEDVRERKMDKVLKCIISLDEVLLDGQMAMYKSLQNAFGVADQK